MKKPHQIIHGVTYHPTDFRKRLIDELVAPKDPSAKRYEPDEMVLGLLAVAATIRKMHAKELGEDLTLVREDLLTRFKRGFDAA